MPTHLMLRTSMFLFALVALETRAETVTLDGAQRFQTIDGFGTNINSLSFTNANSRQAIDLLADQMGQTLWRVVFDMMDWEDPNDNADPMVANAAYYDALYGNAKFQNLWSTLRYLNQKGFSDTIALSFMGRLANWMGGATLSMAQEDEAVEAIVTLVIYARNTAHVQFGLLDPFNESDWNGNEGPQLSAAQYTRLIAKILTRLDAAGISDLKILGPNTADVGSGVSSYAPAMLANPTVAPRVHRFAFHSYGGSTGNAASLGSVGFWMSEYAQPSQAFPLLEQGARGLLVWEGFDSIYNHAIDRGEPAVPGNDDVGSVPLEYVAGNPVTYRPRKEFYQDAQLFKYVPPGAVRVGTRGQLGALAAVAFTHQATQRVTVVVYNSGPSVSLSGTLRSLPTVASFSQFITDSSRNLASGPAIAVTQGQFSLTIPTGSWVTLTATGAPADAGVGGGSTGGGSAGGGSAGGGSAGGGSAGGGSAGGGSAGGGSAGGGSVGGGSAGGGTVGGGSVGGGSAGGGSVGGGSAGGGSVGGGVAGGSSVGESSSGGTTEDGGVVTSPIVGTCGCSFAEAPLAFVVLVFLLRRRSRQLRSAAAG